MSKFLTLLCVIFILSPIAVATEHDIKQLISRFEQSQTILRKSNIKGERLRETYDSANSINPQWSRDFYEINRNEGQLDLHTTRWLKLKSADETLDMSMGSSKRMLWDNTMWYEYAKGKPDTPPENQRAYFSTDKKYRNRCLAIGYTGSPVEG